MATSSREDFFYAHQVIDHAESYVRGKVHTNGLENFWSLLKRGIKGTYVSVEPWHLFRYLDEQAFRFNQRRDPDGDAGRFLKVLRMIVGRRLTYKELIGQSPTPHLNHEEGGDAMSENARPPTPYERFVAATKAILSVSKKDMDAEMQKLRRQRKTN